MAWIGINEIQSGKHNNFLFQRVSFCRGIPMRRRTCIKPHPNYDLNWDLNSITSVFSALPLIMFCVFHRIASSLQETIICRLNSYIMLNISSIFRKKPIFLKWMNNMMSLAYTFTVYYYSKGVLRFISLFFFS